MDLSPEELKRIADFTLEHYNERADQFWEGTRDHDVSQNIDALLSAIAGSPPFDILDVGCGPGRDLATFKSMGHRPVGLEGTPRFAEMARSHSGCEVIEQSFMNLDLPLARFDGVFANASLFHVPKQILPQVLKALFDTLRPGGVLFSSNPRGEGQEGWQNGRYGAFHDLASWRQYLGAAGFAELSHYYRPKGMPIERQGWLASVWRKPRGSE